MLGLIAPVYGRYWEVQALALDQHYMTHIYSQQDYFISFALTDAGLFRFVLKSFVYFDNKDCHNIMTDLYTMSSFILPIHRRTMKAKLERRSSYVYEYCNIAQQ